MVNYLKKLERSKLAENNKHIYCFFIILLSLLLLLKVFLKNKRPSIKRSNSVEGMIRNTHAKKPGCFVLNVIRCSNRKKARYHKQNADQIGICKSTQKYKLRPKYSKLLNYIRVKGKMLENGFVGIRKTPSKVVLSFRACPSL